MERILNRIYKIQREPVVVCPILISNKTRAFKGNVDKILQQKKLYTMNEKYNNNNNIPKESGKPAIGIELKFNNSICV